MPYIQRRDGEIVGVYAMRQPGYAEEFLADDHPDFVAFRERGPFGFVAQVKAECRRRILSVVDETAQMNLAAERADMPPADVLVYRQGLQWIRDMRGTSRRLVAARDQSYSNDRHWPVPDPAIVALAAKY